MATPVDMTPVAASTMIMVLNRMEMMESSMPGAMVMSMS